MALDNLTQEQLNAVKHGSGPLLIIAGAGTGKTTVITERIKYLLLEKKIDPSEVLALTFTEKASYEMQERLDILLPYGYSDLWINTFHSFCDRILRNEVHNMGLDPNYRLITESESVLLLRQNIFDLSLKIFRPLGNPTKFLEALLIHFSRLKDEDIAPEQYKKWAENQKRKKEKRDEEKIIAEQYLELASAYKKFEDLKIKQSFFDFSDLISNTLLLFRKRRDILKNYQKQFKFILVDEFQDTNYAQNELAILLAGDDKNITVVADDDQSIYRFRGAAVSNVLQFKKNFPKAKIITLTENFRSTQTILDASYLLIQNNNPNRLEIVEKIDKKLKSKTGTREEKIELVHALRADDEADEIAKKIEELSKKYDYKDIAVLVRANNHAASITTALQRHRIPYQFLGPGYLFQQEEIKDLIAYITFLTNLTDTISLFRVLSMDIFNIPYIELNYLLNFAKKKNLSLFESLYELNQTFLKEETIKKLEFFRKMVESHLERSKKEQAGQIIFDFLKDTKLYEKYITAETISEERIVQNISKFFDRVKNFETERKDANIFTLAEWLSLMLQMGDSPTAADVDIRDQNAVNILTVHSSKGLEFKVVFLVNLVTDRFPSRERAEKIPLPKDLIKEELPAEANFHLQEERRLFYVGMTRAKEKLYFTASDYYSGGKRIKKISQFVYEATPEFLNQKRIETKQLSIQDALSVYQKKGEMEDKKIPYKVDYITYSNLQMFDICPLHYKAKVIFNLPSPQTSMQSFGVSVHNALYDFYKSVQEGAIPNLTDLKKFFEEEWINEGYSSKKHEKESFQNGIKILKNYYNTEGKKKIVPLGLEYQFKFSLRNGVKVFGKIDRIDPKGNGIEIIDYKTGEDNPKASSSHEFQLSIYALAANRLKDKILNRDPKDITLTLHFLDGNTRKTMNFTKENLTKLEDELIEKIEEIEKSDFKCSGNVLCLNCEYRLLCNTIR